MKLTLAPLYYTPVFEVEVSHFVIVAEKCYIFINIKFNFLKKLVEL